MTLDNIPTSAKDAFIKAKRKETFPHTYIIRTAVEKIKKEKKKGCREA